MKLFIYALLIFSQSHSDKPQLSPRHNKRTAIVYQPEQEVVVRKLFSDQSFHIAGIEENDGILEINNQVVFGLAHYYSIINGIEGTTSS